jgi:hypothetical protein
MISISPNSSPHSEQRHERVDPVEKTFLVAGFLAFELFGVLAGAP